MRIDAYTHFFPKKFFDKMLELAGDHKDLGKRVRAIPALYDLDHRMKIVDSFPDYAQILSYPMPPLENFASADQVDGLCRIIMRTWHPGIPICTSLPVMRMAQFASFPVAGAPVRSSWEITMQVPVRPVTICCTQMGSNVVTRITVP